MKKILALNGSPRPAGNTGFLLQKFLDGAAENHATIEAFRSQELKVDFCSGCLRCNILKRCSMRGDDWADLSLKILEADVLVFASPVYFHHLTASLKIILDRFRSFTHVQITETGLIHTPHHEWNKDFVLLLTMGSPDPSEAQPIIDLFRFMTGMLGAGNRLHVVTATRLAVSRQVVRTEPELLELYPKLGLSAALAGEDFKKNAAILSRCEELGRQLS